MIICIYLVELFWVKFVCIITKNSEFPIADNYKSFFETKSFLSLLGTWKITIFICDDSIKLSYVRSVLFRVTFQPDVLIFQQVIINQEDILDVT